MNMLVGVGRIASVSGRGLGESRTMLFRTVPSRSVHEALGMPVSTGLRPLAR
jgi:hypothetical protein